MEFEEGILTTRQLCFLKVALLWSTAFRVSRRSSELESTALNVQLPHLYYLQELLRLAFVRDNNNTFYVRYCNHQTSRL